MFEAMKRFFKLTYMIRQVGDPQSQVVADSK
jgi:hypothetical protein